jgi:hypothetical protein
MPRGTQSVPVPTESANPPALAPDAFEEMFDGLPEEQREIPTHRIAGDDPAAPIPPGYYDPPAGQVILTNLRYPEEVIFAPSEGTDGKPVFNAQRSVQFINGRVAVSEDEAAHIKRVSPYVHIEPTEGDVLTFPATGFTTRSAAVLAEYAARYADSL